MKALTVYQPWASLIIVGAKPYEFRSWSPRARGGAYAALIGQRIIIHASTRLINRAEVQSLIMRLERGGDDAALTCLHADKAIPVLEKAMDRDMCLLGHGDLPWGVGIGSAILGEPRNGFDIAREFGATFVNDSDRHEQANFGWPMLEVEQWDMPVEARGLQGFWNWPTPESVGL